VTTSLVSLEEFAGLGPSFRCNDLTAFLFIRSRMTRFPVRCEDTKREIPTHMAGRMAGAFPVGREPNVRWFVKCEKRSYHHSNGVFRCPVGWLVSKEIYNTVAPKEWQIKPGGKDTWGRLIDVAEGESIYTPHVQEAVRRSWGCLPDVKMLHELQELHDNYLPIFWQPALDDIGRRRGWLA